MGHAWDNVAAMKPTPKPVPAESSTEVPSTPPAEALPGTVTCATCRANCCKLEVMLMGDDDIPTRYTERDAWGGWIMRRLDDGWCAALDRETMLCTIYQRRPMICDLFEMGGYDCLEERAKTGR